jgi:hypothetical protein
MFLITNQLHAQRSVEISPLIGYTFSGEANNLYYNGRIAGLDLKDAMSFGATVGFSVGDMVQGELSYTHIDTRAVRYAGNSRAESFDIGIEYYQLGAVKEFGQNPSLLPFAKFSLGANRYWDKAKVFDSRWFFSGVIGVGVKKYLSDRVGIKLYSNLNLPMQFNGVGLWFGTGGVDSGVSFNVPLVHWDLGAGLVFKLER